MTTRTYGISSFDLARGSQPVLARQVDIHQDDIGHQLPRLSIASRTVAA